MRGRAWQVILLCALAFALVGMHHVTAAGEPHQENAAVMSVMPADQPDVDSPASDQHPGMPMSAHDLLHLCMAVLFAAGAVLLGFWFLLRTIPTTYTRTLIGARASPRKDRPPGITGRVLLTSLCVLRL
jgi:hypothetical protein